ncbi:MAG: signal recognition particle-docking protein FtsY [Actinomycetota bacterium]
MPDGMVPELLVFLFLVSIVLGAVLVARRPAPEETAPEGKPEAAEERAAGPVEIEVPEVVEPPDEDVAKAPPAAAERAALEAVEVLPTERPSLRARLAKSRRFFADRLADALGGDGDGAWDELEAVLIQADVGAEAAAAITSDLRATAGREASDAAEMRSRLADELVSRFDLQHERALVFAPEGVTVWLVVGVNGTGKTTTIGKLARDLTGRGRTVALAAADTFRAAADEQLGIWADRAGAELVKHQPGADPGAVAYDAFQHARARELDVLIVDTAGRLHTKTPLMEELGKVRRVIEKEGKVQEALLVIDATAGQNGLVQAKQFAEAIGVTGIVLTKLDGTAKGGIALAIEETLGIPIKLIGVGEGAGDLEAFDPKGFVDALLS